MNRTRSGRLKVSKLWAPNPNYAQVGTEASSLINLMSPAPTWVINLNAFAHAIILLICLLQLFFSLPVLQRKYKIHLISWFFYL